MNGILQGAEETTHEQRFISVTILTSSGFFICFFNKFQRVRKSWAASCCTNTARAESTIQSVSWTSPSTDFPQMAKGEFCPLLDTASCPLVLPAGTELRLGTSCNFSTWPEQAVGEDRRVCTTQCKSCVLVTRYRDKRMLNTYQRMLWVGRSPKHHLVPLPSTMGKDIF